MLGLVIHVSKIPPEGLSIDTPLNPGEVHLEGEDSFGLKGGTLRCHVERGHAETVHVRGRLTAEVALSCGRCLEPFTLPLEQELDLFYLPHDANQEQEEEDEVELSDRDVVVAYYEGDRLDLGSPETDLLADSLAYNKPDTKTLTWNVPDSQTPSQPFWLRKPSQGDLYTIDDQLLIGVADSPPVLGVFHTQHPPHHIAVNRIPIRPRVVFSSPVFLRLELG